MLFGAVAVLVTGQISPIEALGSVDVDVMLFLFGMFILFTMGILSAFLLNNTVAIIGTPLLLLLARDNEMSPKPLLLASPLR